MRVECPPGEFRCFCGTTEDLATRVDQMRARIAALAGRSDRFAADDGHARREQLNRWHHDDHATEDRADATGWSP